jgi:predicted enzyme related to lactoylglutathione lyase
MLSGSRGALVSLQARDFERAVAFYKDVLGLPMTFRHESYWAEFQAPGLAIGIEAAADDAVVGGGTIALCFEVRRIENVVAGLRTRGISFVGPVRETFHGKEAYFADSEGNPLLLHESASEAREAAAGRDGKAARAAKKGASKVKAKAAAPKRTASKAKGAANDAKSARGKRVRSGSRSAGSRGAAAGSYNARSGRMGRR